MTATTGVLPSLTRPGPTLPVVAGRVLATAGLVFGLSNLFQYGVQAGLLGLHPAVLGLSWPVAVTAFLVTLFRIRKGGGDAGRRAAGWSRLAILAMLGSALSLLALGFATRDFTTMLWMSPVGMGLYAIAWTTASVRARRAWMIVPAIGALIAAGVTLSLLGTPNQYLAYAAGLFAFVFTPGAWMALGGKA